MTTVLNGQQAQYRQHCFDRYVTERTDGTPSTPAQVSVMLMTELATAAPQPTDKNSFGITRLTAENIIRAMFVRKYNAAGTYVNTVGPDFSEHDVKFQNSPPGVPAILGGIQSLNSPDFTHAASLSKADLDTYAGTFGIDLNQSNTKDNMMLDFQSQWAAK